MINGKLVIVTIETLVGVNHSHTVDAVVMATNSVPNLNANRFVLVAKSLHPIRTQVTVVAERGGSCGVFFFE